MGYVGQAPADAALTGADITDGIIANVDIASDAAIALSKTALSAGTGISLSTNTLNVDAAQTQITSVGTIATGTWEGTTVAVDQGGTGATTLNNLITLATHTTGDYVQNITAGTGLTSTGATSGENIAHSLSVDAAQTGITSVGTLSSLVIANAGTIGSASDTDAIAISSGGVVTFSQSVTLADDATITLQDEGQIIFADDDPSTDDTGVGIVMKFTALTSLVVGELVHIDANGKIDQAHPAAGVSTRVPAIGIALEANSSGSDAEVKVLLLGVYKDTSQFNFTPGEEVYAGHSGEGEFTQTPTSTDGHHVQRVGVALTADSIYFNPSLDVIEHA